MTNESNFHAQDGRFAPMRIVRHRDLETEPVLTARINPSISSKGRRSIRTGRGLTDADFDWSIQEVGIISNGLEAGMDPRLNQARVKATPQAIKQGLNKQLRIVRRNAFRNGGLRSARLPLFPQAYNVAHIIARKIRSVLAAIQEFKHRLTRNVRFDRMCVGTAHTFLARCNIPWNRSQEIGKVSPLKETITPGTESLATELIIRPELPESPTFFCCEFSLLMFEGHLGHGGYCARQGETADEREKNPTSSQSKRRLPQRNSFLSSSRPEPSPYERGKGMKCKSTQS